MIKKAFDILFSKEHELLRKQFIKFFCVGLLNTLLCYIAFNILTDIFLINDKLANIIGYIIGVTNSYIFNKFWTFKSDKFQFKEFIIFVIIFLFSLGLQLGIYTILTDYLSFHQKIAFIIGMVFYTLTNFLLNKFITFKK